jgi:cellobiose-specific phosphotransferase system component IIA
MAIKGKTKKRGGGARARALPPKPIITERKPHLFARRWFKRTAVAVLALAALLGGVRVWQNKGRSSSLLRYDRALARAGGLLKQHLNATALTSVTKSASEFSAGSLDAKRFQDLAGIWEKDFEASGDAVGKLKPPGPLAQAQSLIAQGIDAYRGVARLYQAAGIQKGIANEADALAKAAKDAAQKKKLQAQAKKDADQVQVLMVHASEWRVRADKLLSEGIALIQTLNASWHVPNPPSVAITDAGATGGIPPGGLTVP